MDLKNLYYDPRTGLSNMNAFYIRAKKLGYDRKEVAKFLSRQEAYQINKQQPDTPYFPIWGMPHTFQADTLDMGAKEYRGWRYILNIINVNTREAWAIPCKKKSVETDLFIEWFKTNKVKVMQVDLGSEFSSKLDAYCEKEDITLRKVRKGESTDQGKVERFNGSLRRLITMYCTMFKTDDWVTDLPKLMQNYNSRFSQPLGMAPNEATEETTRVKNWEQFKKAQDVFDSFSIGERVRKLIHKASTFTKGRKRWSKEIYTIDDIRHHEFHIGGVWVKSWEVQKIPDNSPDGFNGDDTRVDEVIVRKAKKITRDLRKEGIDVNAVIKGKRTRAKV
jgi:transposase InsO family protein